MNRLSRILLTILITLAVVMLIAILSIISGQKRHEKTCSGVEIVVLDSLKLQFVTKEDVKNILDKDYGTFVGQRLDSVNLRKIESMLDGRSAISKSEAYTTAEDGILHIEVTQREPILMFKTTDGGFYADENGWIFPLQGNYTTNGTIIEGNIPIHVEADYKGQPKTEKEREWLSGIIDMMKYLKKNKQWEYAISRISVNEDGDLVMHPRKGKEAFVFGHPDNFADKFRRMEEYYTTIAPTKDEGYYSTVNVKYDGQIICRQ